MWKGKYGNINCDLLEDRCPPFAKCGGAISEIEIK